MGKAILHGEVLIHKTDVKPENAVKIRTKGKYHIVADSEISGNHHVIDLKDGVEFFEKDGILYLVNDVETHVRCVIADRHDAITIEPGIWEIDRQQEYDPFEARLRVVSD